MGVFLSIRQHVDDGVTDRAGRRDRSGVIAVCPHGAAASANAIHGAGNADREPAEPTGKARPVLGLNQQMQVIILRREFDNPESLVRGLGKGAADSGKDAGGPEAADGGRGAQRNMDGMRGLVGRARTVRDAGPLSWCALAAGAGPATAPRGRYGEAELRGASSHRGS